MLSILANTDAAREVVRQRPVLPIHVVVRCERSIFGTLLEHAALRLPAGDSTGTKAYVRLATREDHANPVSSPSMACVQHSRNVPSYGLVQVQEVSMPR